jgi:hypothetical protein
VESGGQRVQERWFVCGALPPPTASASVSRHSRHSHCRLQGVWREGAEGVRKEGQREEQWRVVVKECRSVGLFVAPCLHPPPLQCLNVLIIHTAACGEGGGG